jgi:hypothetical protein
MMVTLNSRQQYIQAKGYEANGYEDKGKGYEGKVKSKAKKW